MLDRVLNLLHAIDLFWYRLNMSMSQNLLWLCYSGHPVNIYLLKVDYRNTWKRCEIWSELIIKPPELLHWRRSRAFIVYFEHILHLFVVFLLLNVKE